MKNIGGVTLEDVGLEGVSDQQVTKEQENG